MQLFLKKYGQFIFLFFFILYGFLVAYNLYFGDTIVNYGFSYAITRGEIPYVDYNLIIPLFSPFLYSIFLFVCKSFLFYYIVQSIFVVLFFVVVSKLLDNKWYLLLPIVFLGFPIPIVTILFPGYNFVLLFLLILAIYCEIRGKNDYLIGFILGLMILTKHSLGILFLLPSFLYFKNLKKIGKRFVGAIIPISIFLLYLFFSNSFSEFVNLCILGLFDFAGENSTVMEYWLWLPFLVCFGYVFFCILKRKKDIFGYYVLISSFFVYPLFDAYHLSFFLFLTMCLFLYYSKFTCKRIAFHIFVFLVFLASLWTFITLHFQDGLYYFQNYPHYPLRYLKHSDRKSYQEIQGFMRKWEKPVILFGLGTENYFYKITNDLDITYFDLPNYGNYGFDGTKMMIEKFEKLPNYSAILIDENVLEDDSYYQQYYKELAYYVIENYHKLKKVGRYTAYIKE
ncbi:MAG: hypothetical protein PUE33_00875 [bacterium]|nr:hypothetical protein [bacterium]